MLTRGYCLNVELKISLFSLLIQTYFRTYCCNGKKNFDSPETVTLEENWTGTKMAYTKNCLK